MSQFPQSDGPSGGSAGDDGGSCAIPPQVYEIAFGWDPAPECDRFLALAGDAPMAAALELGCGAGRLIAAMASRVGRVVGVELSPAMVALARTRLAERGLAERCRIDIGDMGLLDFDAEFDLVYSSANSIRHVIENDAIAAMWRSIARALRPGGAAVIDLELGIAYETQRLGNPATWALSTDNGEVRASWGVVSPPAGDPPQARIRWTFEQRSGGNPVQMYTQEFPLRVYDAPDLVDFAAQAGLGLAGFYEPRDPYLLPVDVGRACGRCLAAFRKPASE